MLLRKPVLCADRAENTEIMATDHAKWADKSRKLRALFVYLLHIGMIHAACGRWYGERALIKWSDGASPMANTRNVISDDVDLRVIWGKHAQLCQNPADTHRKTIVLFVFRISLRCLWVRYPIFLFFEHPVFRAFRAIKNSLRSLNIHRKVRR